MEFYAFHGVGEQERAVGNRFFVDLLLTAAVEAAVRSDRLEDTVSYADVFAVVRREMSVPSRLLEHAAGRILFALQEAFPLLTGIEVRLTKLCPPLGGDVRSASVVLRQGRDD
ncbi:Dihydroneopterin aldolase [Bacteroidales bacterium Barb6]|nr:Dihydroneopterin aldolase [Bacteroidales bacterium Barb6]